MPAKSIAATTKAKEMRIRWKVKYARFYVSICVCVRLCKYKENFVKKNTPFAAVIKRIVANLVCFWVNVRVCVQIFIGNKKFCEWHTGET